MILSMVNKYSIASKMRWAKIPKEERSLMMSRIAKIKHKKMTKAEKVLHMKRMNDAKKAGNSG